jgi:hypothetical protein
MERQRRRDGRKGKGTRKGSDNEDDEEREGDEQEEEDDSSHVANSRELTRRYYAHSLDWHPDRWAGEGVPAELQKKAAGVFALVSEAHKFLKKYVAEQAEAPCTATNPYCPQQQQEEEEDGEESGFSYVRQLTGAGPIRKGSTGSTGSTGSDGADAVDAGHEDDGGDEMLTRVECTGPAAKARGSEGRSRSSSSSSSSKRKNPVSGSGVEGETASEGGYCRVLKTKVPSSERSNTVGLRKEKRSGESWGWGGKKAIQSQGKEPEKLTALRAFMGFNVQRPKLLHPADRFETEEAMQEYYSTHLP